MFSEINELKSIREQKCRLQERERELSRPMLKDVELIPRLYEWFNEIEQNRDYPFRRGGTRMKKQFIYIIMYLYSPGTLAGGKIGIGIRDRLGAVLSFKSPTGVSNLSADVTFLYATYKDFRHDVDYFYTEILKRLEQGGWMEVEKGLRD